MRCQNEHPAISAAKPSLKLERDTDTSLAECVGSRRRWSVSGFIIHRPHIVLAGPTLYASMRS